MKRIKILFLLVMVCALFSPVFAQGEGFHFEIDDAIVAAIMTIGGLGVIAITQIVKNALVKLFNVVQEGVKNFLGYVSSLIVSAGASAFILLQMKKFTWLALLGYMIYVWLEVNQIFKVIHKPAAKPA
jgi:hypothetical protein